MKRRLSLFAAAVFMLTALAPSARASILPWENPQNGKADEMVRSGKSTARPTDGKKWPVARPEPEQSVEQQPAEGQLRPEMLDLLNSDVPRDGKVEVKAKLFQDLGEAITADVSWDDDESPAVRLHNHEEHAFRLSPEPHVLRVRCDTPPLFSQASATVDLTEGRPHRVEIHVEPRFNGANIHLQIYRGEWKIFDKHFLAPDA